MGMLTVKCFHHNKSSFCLILIFCRSYECHNIEVNLANICFGDIAGLKTVVPVCGSVVLRFQGSRAGRTVSFAPSDRTQWRSGMQQFG